MATRTVEAEPEKMVMVFVPEGKDENEVDIYVSINEREFTVRRGEWVSVPECVADVLRHSIAQDAEARRRRMELSTGSAQRQ